MKDASLNSDEKLLQLFGLSSYQRSNSHPDFGRYAVFSNDGSWTLLADDWLYTLWNMKSTKGTITELARKFDVFACSVGDCDNAFDFVYYRDTRLIRRYAIAYPNFRDGIVTENVGDPLPEESNAFKESDPLITVLRIAASIGIGLDFEQYGIRIYVDPVPFRSSLDPSAAPISNIR
jgi:hypothetical protein